MARDTFVLILSCSVFRVPISDRPACLSVDCTLRRAQHLPRILQGQRPRRVALPYLYLERLFPRMLLGGATAGALAW